MPASSKRKLHRRLWARAAKCEWYRRAQTGQRASRRKRSMARWAWGWAKRRRSWPLCLVPAQEKAGLKQGDKIISVEGKAVKEREDLMAVMANKAPGDKVRVVFERDGKQQTVEVTLGQPIEQQSPPMQQQSLPPGAEAMSKSLYKPVKGAIRAIAFLDDKIGYAVGDEGLCKKTIDGGTTWQKMDTGSKATYRAILLIDKDTVYLCGDGDPDAHAVGRGHTVMFGRPMQNSTVAYTRDGGKTWTAVEVATNFELTAIVPKKDADFLVGTFGGEMHRDGDFGVFHAKGSWSDGTNQFKGGELRTKRVYRALTAMCRIDDTHFAAVGSPVSVGFKPTPTDELYTAHGARAIFSSDGGETWKPAKGSDGKDVLRALAYRKGQPLVAVGDNGAILLSHDNGVTWDKVDSPVKTALAGVAWSGGDAPIALAVGKQGAMAKPALTAAKPGSQRRSISR